MSFHVVKHKYFDLLATRDPRFHTLSGHILLFFLPLIQEGQLSVTEESRSMKYW